MKRVLCVFALALCATGAVAQSDRGDRRRDGIDHRDERVERRDDRRDDRREDRADRRDDRRDRVTDRDRHRGLVIRFGAPGFFVRTLPARTRYVYVNGRRCQVTITRRLTYRGDIVTTERRRCPGRPDVIIRSR